MVTKPACGRIALLALALAAPSMGAAFGVRIELPGHGEISADDEKGAALLLRRRRSPRRDGAGKVVGQILTDAVKEGGNSLFENNRCDWVQGEMALEFGEWLVGDTGLTREQLSPINQNVSGLAPIYLQGGGKEILIDMIRDFATAARNQGPEVLLDVWEHMTHDFQGYGVDLAESREVLGRMSEVAEHYVAGRAATMAHTTKPEWRHDWEAV